MWVCVAKINYVFIQLLVSNICMQFPAKEILGIATHANGIKVATCSR
jgi:hypothetical protein